MMRLRHKAHGVIVNVDDETGDRLLGGSWERAEKSQPKSQAKAAPKKAPTKQAAPAEAEGD